VWALRLADAVISYYPDGAREIELCAGLEPGVISHVEPAGRTGPFLRYLNNDEARAQGMGWDDLGDPVVCIGYLE